MCASVVGGAVFPNRLAPSLVERTDVWFRDAAFYVKETLSGRIAGQAISASRQRLAATVNQLEFLLSQLAYDHTRPDILARAHAMRGRMQLLLPIVSALADPLTALLGGANARPEGLAALLADVVKWFDAPLDANNATMQTTRPSAKPMSCADASPRSNRRRRNSPPGTARCCRMRSGGCGK